MKELSSALLARVNEKNEGVTTFSLGVGLTNECDLSCDHCYRSQLKLDRLSLAEVKRICASLPVGSVSLGVGENGLHPQYHEILSWLYSEGYKTALTSNGYSIEILSDEELSWLHSVEFSIDFPTEEEQDGWRAPGNWQKCWEGVARCQSQGVPTALMAVWMSTNYNRLGELAAVAASHGADFRFNIYQPVRGDAYSLTYEQFWAGLLDVVSRTDIITISEPLVNALLALPRATQGSPCGKTSLRVLPNGLVSPCTYWPKIDRRLTDLYRDGSRVLEAPAFQQARQVPAGCQECPLVESCGGGCASRRLLRGSLDLPDEFCPLARGDSAMLEELARLKWRMADFREMPKAGNACTFMFRARTEGVAS